MLAWSADIALAHPEMDATHEEFVALLAECERALGQSEAAGLRAWQALITHTEAHFGQEDEWMQATGFGPANCHTYQHNHVLMMMREVGRLAQDHHDLGPLRRILQELGPWFVQHVDAMDAALARHLQSQPALSVLA